MFSKSRSGYSTKRAYRTVAADVMLIACFVVHINERRFVAFADPLYDLAPTVSKSSKLAWCIYDLYKSTVVPRLNDMA